ncbi:hypothetical protein CCR75_006109 [Bremia lactucae]|uniref:UDENN domain-containing protein n=1 Tax=Bremia lactucae TaxID=4779 RepID=A0A976IIU0_BRELC|nr:hypothetical protein CCR75_006109 [Bremia lactucae]
MTEDETSTVAMRRLAEVVLYAEFDLTKGSTLRGSYPTRFAHYSPEFFADMMLPEGVHNREEDFTIFFLNRQDALQPRNNDNNLHEPQGKILDKTQDPLQRFMYCLSVVRTTHDATARRGAKVTAVALCSSHKSCLALKEVLNMAVLKIVESESDEASEKVLQDLFAVVNAVDITGVRGLSNIERRLMKCTISSTERAVLSSKDTKNVEKELFFRTQAKWEDRSIPLQVKLCSTKDQHDNGMLIHLLRTFGEQTMVLFNAVLTGQRVILLGYNRPAGEVCNLVLATSSLVCPPLFGLLCRQFPYAHLTDLGFLLTPGFIAGVTNPMFKTKREWWDVLCDISTGDVIVSTPTDKEDYDNVDRTFVLEVLDGVAAGYDEEWVRCMFEEFTLNNIVNIALGNVSNLNSDALAKRSAINSNRITKWSRTDNYKLFMNSPHLKLFYSPAFKKHGVNIKRHIQSLQGDLVVLNDALVEKIYSDFATLLNTELELQEFLSFLPAIRGGVQTIAQGIFHPSISVKHNTVALLKRLEQFPSTVSSMQHLNPFLLMSYQRIYDIVNPETRD